MLEFTDASLWSLSLSVESENDIICVVQLIKDFACFDVVGSQRKQMTSGCE